MAGGESEEPEERALSRPAAPLGTAPEALGTSRPEAPRSPMSDFALLTAPRDAGVKRTFARIARNRWSPLIVLVFLLAFSIASKSVDLSQPCSAPCTAKSKHTLIFDESYYVNAARVIDGIEPPAGDPYHGDPKGDDPNAEHPQLAKLVIAAGIDVFGDNPLGWRIGSILFSAIALLALYALVCAAGGSAWLAVGTVAVMCMDNLMLVHGRIATLDIYAVTMMLIAGVLYMRKRPLLAGLALGVAACMKEVALFLMFVFILLEALRIARGWVDARRSEALATAAGPQRAAAPLEPTASEIGVVGESAAGRLGPDGAPAARATGTDGGPGIHGEPTTSATGTDGAPEADASGTDGEPAARAAGTDGTPTTGTAGDDDTPTAGALATAGAPTVSAPAKRGEIRYGSRRGLALDLVSEHAPPLIIFLISGALATLGLLWLLDVLVPAYDPGTHTIYSGDPFAHLAHMYNYALLLKSKPNETGITSSPLAWLLNEKAINYAKVAVNTLVNGKIVGSHATISFQGVMNPFIIFLAIPALFASLAAAWKQRDEVGALGACWCLGTYLPFLIGDLSSGRVSYLYYMLLAMPGIYIVTTRMFASERMPKAATIGWAIVLIYGFIHLYPIRTLL